MDSPRLPSTPPPAAAAATAAARPVPRRSESGEMRRAGLWCERSRMAGVGEPPGVLSFVGDEYSDDTEEEEEELYSEDEG